MITSTQKISSTPLPFNDGCNMIVADFGKKLDLVKIIQPETTLEKQLLALPEFQEGLNWGKPRFGHPEGKVGLHIREVLDNVDALKIEETIRQDLRMLSIVHDAFKYQEVGTIARGNRIHHGKIARDFVANKIENDALLEIIELHDEAFYVWRQLELQNDARGAMMRLDRLLDRLGSELPLYFLFFKCDTETGDKIQAPLRWFETTIEELASDEVKSFISSSI